MYRHAARLNTLAIVQNQYANSRSPLFSLHVGRTMNVTILHHTNNFKNTIMVYINVFIIEQYNFSFRVYFISRCPLKLKTLNFQELTRRSYYKNYKIPKISYTYVRIY